MGIGAKEASSAMSVGRNTFYNLAGAALPTVGSLIAVPLYLQQIGAARYGVLAIVWLLLDYFGLFDLGLSRATVNYIAKHQTSSDGDREQIFWTACILNAAFGAFGGLVLYVVGVPLLGHWLKMSTELHSEIMAALPWIAGSVPLATVTAVFTGALEGRERFGAVNAIQTVTAVLIQGLPLVAAFVISPKLQVVIPTAVISRILSVAPLLIAVKIALPLRGCVKVRLRLVGELLGYGAWVAVSRVISPIIVSVDRFLIGAMLGVAAVAYYVVPFNLAKRTQVVQYSLARTQFPRLSANTLKEAKLITEESVSALITIMTPVIIVCIFAVRPFLSLWIGPAFSAQAAPAGEVLFVGVWINGLAFMPYNLLQAKGRPDITAKIHALEVLPFVGLLWWSLQAFGLFGAAVSWTLRVTVDAALQFHLGLSGLFPRRFYPAFALIMAAWVCVYKFPAGFSPTRMAIGALLALTACVWGLYSDARTRKSAIVSLRALIAALGAARTQRDAL